MADNVLVRPDNILVIPYPWLALLPIFAIMELDELLISSTSTLAKG